MGLGAGLLVVLLAHAIPTSWRAAQRERIFDTQLSLTSGWRKPGKAPDVALIDIDSASLETQGPWPWRREVLARLVTEAFSAGAATVAVDIVIAGADTRSSAAVARRLADETGQASLLRLADTLVSDDQLLADAMRDKPVAMGWVLDPRSRTTAVKVPIFFRGEPEFGPLWTSPGAVGPVPLLSSAAAGSGVMSLPGDEDGVVRRVPLLVTVGGDVFPGLAAEALRLSVDASGYLVSAGPSRLRIGDHSIPLPPNGLLRLVPPGAQNAPPSISAMDVLHRREAISRLKGAIVFIGGSAPELGALRPSLIDPLTPSMLLQALAVRQLAAGIVPARSVHAHAGELIAAALAGLGAAFAALRLRPLAAGAAAVVSLMAIAAAATAASAWDMLVDPSLPLASGAGAFLVTSFMAFSGMRRQEARLRRRFEQHLAPGVVERIVADPGSLRLSGERRHITALFTDIEGFTQATSTVPAEQLIAVLDGYFEGVADIVTRHGGMIDKFVGDAVHAFFNIPLDLVDHTERALACAIEIKSWTTAYEKTALPSALPLGPTRIGIETGDAVVGDVGLSTKLDYTAHGSVVNTAARLEALNKDLATWICIGPVAASHCKAMPLRSLGEVEVRGIGRLEVFTPAS
jgi:adenylate cyclase